MIEFKAFTRADWDPYMGAEPFSTGEEPLIHYFDGENSDWDIVIDRHGIQVHHGEYGDSYVPNVLFREINYSDTAGLIERINKDRHFLDNVKKYWVKL